MIDVVRPDPPRGDPRQEGRRLRLILNLRAATDDQVRLGVEAVRAAGHTVDVRVLWEPCDVPVFTAEAVRDGVEGLLVAGGDGTLNLVANALLRLENPPRRALGILPFGTANDLATACGLVPEQLARSFQLAAEAEPVPVDVGLLNGVRWFLNAATCGFAARVTTDTPAEAKRFLGRFAYLLTGLASVASLEPREVRLRTPALEWRGPIYGIVVANGVQAGGGVRVAPRALLDDGLLDVLVIKEVPWTRLLALLDEVLQLPGQDPELAPESDQLLQLQTPWLELVADEELQVNLDGEPVLGERFRFEACPRLLPLYLPAEAPLQRRPVEAPLPEGE